MKKYPKLVKSPYYRLDVFIKILPFLQCAQNTKQFISVDSLSLANGTLQNNFVVMCMVVKISRDKVLESTIKHFR